MWCPAEEFALAGLFGAFPLDATNDRGEQMMIHGVDDVGTWNEMGKVFPTSGFKQLFEQYKASYTAGGAHIFPATYEVRAPARCWVYYVSVAHVSEDFGCIAGLNCWN